MTKFQVYKDAAGKFRFRLRAGNNQIIAVGEAYEQRASCINGIKSIQKNCSAEIEDLTIKGRKVPNPKYQIYKDAAGEFRFRLKAANGEIIAEGEGYDSKEGCLNGIKVVRSSCDAEIEDLSAPKEPIQENVIPAQMEETAPPPTTEPKTNLGPETAKETQETPPKTETPITTATAETAPTTETEAATAEAKVEDSPQTAPISAEETGSLPSTGPVDTKLELNAAPSNITKGNSVSFQGMLSAADSGKAIAGAEIRIYESKSIFGDDWLAVGRTNQDGKFNINWKARSITWRKNAANIYAKFLGNETAKPSKSSIQSVIIN